MRNGCSVFRSKKPQILACGASLQRKGIALVAAIMLMVFASIAVFGVVTFIGQRLRQHPVEETFLKTIYLAQAGLNYALYQYRQNGTLFSSQVNLDASNYAVVSTTSGGGGGDQASLLEINATASHLASGNKDIQGITLRNTSAASSITLSQMVIYIGSGSKKLSRVRINGSNVWTTDTDIGTSPVTLNMDDVTIPANTTRTVDDIRWKDVMSGQTVYWGFIMGDGTTTSICTVYPPPASTCQGNATLSIKSMGKTTASNIYRTINAVYDTSTGSITSCSETDDTVP